MRTIHPAMRQLTATVCVLPSCVKFPHAVPASLPCFVERRTSSPAATPLSVGYHWQRFRLADPSPSVRGELLVAGGDRHDLTHRAACPSSAGSDPTSRVGRYCWSHSHHLCIHPCLCGRFKLLAWPAGCNINRRPTLRAPSGSWQPHLMVAYRVLVLVRGSECCQDSRHLVTLSCHSCTGVWHGRISSFPTL